MMDPGEEVVRGLGWEGGGLSQAKSQVCMCCGAGDSMCQGPKFGRTAMLS